MIFLGAPANKELQYSRNQHFGCITFTGKVLTNGSNVTQFYAGRCTGIGDMLAQSKMAVNGNAQVYNLACDFDM